MDEMALHNFAYDSMRKYIIETVEDRAIPEFKDGLKPVQRRILWTMYNLGLYYNLAHKKSARISGETMGKFHPHASCYDSMVKLAQASKKYNLIDGQGNWGSYNPTDSAAAERYTECRLSKLANIALLDKNYLKVIPYTLNYDGTEKEPVYLPARLPFILLNRTQGLATAVRTFLPSFDMSVLIDACISYLKDNDTDFKNFDWKFVGTYGGHCISNKEDINNLIEKGSASILFEPDYETLKDKIVITGIQEDFKIDSVAESLEELSEVKNVRDESFGSNIKLVIYLNCKSTDKKAIDKIKQKLYTRDNYAINILHREFTNEGIVAHYNETTVGKLIKNWCKFRLKLEKDYLNMQISEKKKDIDYQELLLNASKNLETIKEALMQEDSDSYLMEKLSWTKEQANTVLDLQIRRLSKLSSTKTEECIKNLKKDLNNLEKKLINIIDTVVQDLLYLKKEFC